MAEPRFLLVWGCTKNGVSLPAWPTAAGQAAGGPDGCWSSWRLLGANNRELGRGAVVYPDDASCLSDLYRGQAGAIDAHSESVQQGGQWTWRLSVDGVPFAVAPRAYQRQRECHYSFQQFLLGLVSARVPAQTGSAAPEKRLGHCLATRSTSCGRQLWAPPSPGDPGKHVRYVGRSFRVAPVT
jgi:hypothetical protein